MTTPRGARDAAHYGPAGFVAALTTIAAFETITWAWFPYFLVQLMLFGIASAIAVPAGLFLSQLPGDVAQIGRGILIGYLATPLTAALILIPTFVITQLLHLA